MAALDDVKELLRAHAALTGGGPGAPPVENGARVGTSLLRAATSLISAAIQTGVEETFKKATKKSFDYFDDEDLDRYWKSCGRWGNPSRANIKSLFFRIGFVDVLDGLSWQKFRNANVIKTLDSINEVRNRVVHGQPLTIGGKGIRLTKPLVVTWQNFGTVFIKKFPEHVFRQYDE